MGLLPWRRGPEEGPPYCSFCQLPCTRKRRVIQRADGLYICDDCVERVMSALSTGELRRLTSVGVVPVPPPSSVQALRRG